VFQPIVALDTATTVAYEALSRGPVDTPLESPDALFAAARSASRVIELDWTCRCAAFRAAFESGLRAPTRLFVNTEPLAVGAGCPTHLVADWMLAYRELDIVVELTERFLLDAPAELLRVRGTLEELGWELALDDVGAGDAGVALLPVLKPGVVKLDRSLLAATPDRAQRAVLTAVQAYVERSGATMVAEGIEDERGLQRAQALGAHWGQGWLFGRPAPLAVPPAPPAPVRRGPSATRGSRAREDPFDALASGGSEQPHSTGVVRRGLTSVCLAAREADPGALLLVQLGSRELEPDGLYALLHELRGTCALVVLLTGADVPVRSQTLRTTVLDDREDSARDGAAVLLGPDRSQAFLARPAADGPGAWRTRSSHDRVLVEQTAQALLSRAAPLRRGGHREQVLSAC